MMSVLDRRTDQPMAFGYTLRACQRVMDFSASEASLASETSAPLVAVGGTA
jgi:hypothetical protein